MIGHVNAPIPIEKFIRIGKCPDCKMKRARFIVLAYDWYGADQTCLNCGRRWSDGQWMPLDFVRGSRQKSIAQAKKAFRRYSTEEIAECKQQFLESLGIDNENKPVNGKE